MCNILKNSILNLFLLNIKFQTFKTFTCKKLANITTIGINYIPYRVSSLICIAYRDVATLAQKHTCLHNRRTEF